MEPITDAHHSGASSFENFPSEIKVMILCHIPCLLSLSSMVHASPSYYQAYLRAREKILHKITIQTLQRNDIGLLDPWTAIHVPHLGRYSPHRTEMTWKYLERYAEGRMDSRRRLASQDSVAILSLHRKLTVLIAKCCKALFSENPYTGAGYDHPLPPSQSELHRLYRAFWRYEIYSKFFGPGNEPSDRVIGIESSEIPNLTFTADEIAKEFFGLFPVHEVEELVCLQEIARDYYRCFESSSSWHGNITQLVALGPKKLYQVMTATSENELEDRIAEGMKTEWVAVTTRDALDAYEKGVRRGSWQWKGMYDNFVGERVPTTAWLWANSHGVDNLQNTCYNLRRWGYVFWDQDRLDGWGITQKHMVRWKYRIRTLEDKRQMWSQRLCFL